MLKQRIISAIFLLTALVAISYFANKLVFTLLVAVFMAILAWEWIGLISASVKLKPNLLLYIKILYIVEMLSVFYALIYFSANKYFEINYILIVATVVFLWLSCFALLLINKSLALIYNMIVLLPLGLIFIGTFGWVMTDLFPAILPVILLVVVIDSGAYIAGRIFGKHKLAPSISPNKTWEGAVGGLVGACVMIFIIWLLNDNTNTSNAIMDLGWLFLFIIPLTAISILGDLLESSLKRLANVKDSGNIIPGHGGLLDRLDALMVVAPVYWLSLQIFPVLSTYFNS